jgi:hypothetical protein
MLLAKGADISATDNEGKNVSHCMLEKAPFRNVNQGDFEMIMSHTLAFKLAVQPNAAGSYLSTMPWIPRLCLR